MKPTILLTGATGQIGGELLRLLPALGEVVAPPREQLDLANLASVRQAIRHHKPNLIVNAAAYTAVDRAESERALAYSVNAEAPAIIAEEAKKLGATLVHYSTDYVFDGMKSTPYDETDAPNPINVYGATKLAGEQGIRASGASHLILRTSWVYAPRGRNFLLTILKLAVEREELRIVSDQLGAPTWSREIAAATVQVLTHVLNPTPAPVPSSAAISGTYHLSASGVTSWYEFATNILDGARRCGQARRWIREATGGRPFLVERVVPIVSAEFPTAARRPPYSVLLNSKLDQTFGVRMQGWKSQLSAVFEED